MSSFSSSTTPSWNIQSASITDLNLRRSSTRSIKRKKFDDELVESSLKCERPRGKVDQKQFNNPILPATQTKSCLNLNFSLPKFENTTTLCSASLQSSNSVLSPASDLISVETSSVECEVPPNNSNNMTEVQSLKVAKGKSHVSKIIEKKAKTSKFNCSIKSSPWRPQDDLLLITAVQQTCDLNAVHLSVKFSCPFSLSDIKERWFNLLYNPDISRPAMTSVRRLPLETTDAIMRKTPFSILEEDLLKTVPSTPKPDLSTFEELLEDNPDSFNHARTGVCLFHHWTMMKEYDLLRATDSKKEKIPTFLEVIKSIDYSDLTRDSGDADLERVYNQGVKMRQNEIAKLESEVTNLKKVVVKNVVGITAIEFDSETYAVLKGRLVQYFMKTKEITFGRSTYDNEVDANLSEEGPAHKISRRHFVIRLETSTIRTQGGSQSDREELRFFLHNQASRVVYVDQFPVHKGRRAQLKDNSIIEVSCLKLSFHVNEDLIESLNRENNHNSTNQNSTNPSRSVPLTE